jgi:hypothetical protein
MKTQKLLLRIGEIFFLVLMGISILLTILFYINANKINPDDQIIQQISQIGPILNVLIGWAIILAGFSVLFAIGFPIIQMIANPKNAIKAVISIGLLAVLLFVAYQLGNGTPLDIAGYHGSDNIPSTLKLTDMIIFSVYVMVVISILSILYAEISKLFK